VHDEGEYTCALGEQECTAEVTVVGKLWALQLGKHETAKQWYLNLALQLTRTYCCMYRCYSFM